MGSLSEGNSWLIDGGSPQFIFVVHIIDLLPISLGFCSPELLSPWFLCLKVFIANDNMISGYECYGVRPQLMLINDLLIAVISSYTNEQLPHNT